MKKVQRSELLDYQTWSDRKPEVFSTILGAKQARRVHVGNNLTFLFENADTIRYQVQEMMRVEQIVRDADIQHELDTYNELLGGDGELGCTLMVEFVDEGERDAMLRAWVGIVDGIYLLLDTGDRAKARYDERQIGRDRLSSVQYLKFAVGSAAPVAIGVDTNVLRLESALSDVQSSALRADLSS